MMDAWQWHYLFRLVQEVDIKIPKVELEDGHEGLEEQFKRVCLLLKLSKAIVFIRLVFLT